MQAAVTRNPKVMHGTPCFAGTRVPVSSLFDWLEEGHTVDFFLEQFPTVTRVYVEAVLEGARQNANQGAIIATPDETVAQ